MELKLRKPGNEIFVPDGSPLPKAIARTSHLGVAAHPDDLEIMAYHGILKCFSSDKDCFFGIIATDGAGSPRAGYYKKCSDEEMKAVRKKEQKKAALVGEYAGVAFLNYRSAELKDVKDSRPRDDIRELITLARPRILYTHNPADKHDTHVAVRLRTIQAIRALPAELRPEKVYGCEVWRDLDWMLDEDKVGLDVKEFVCRYINRFAADVSKRIDKLL